VYLGNGTIADSAPEHVPNIPEHVPNVPEHVLAVPEYIPAPPDPPACCPHQPRLPPPPHAPSSRTIEPTEQGGHSVQISDGYVDNMMTLYRLRHPSGRPPDDT
jgi:hypothetical protein